MANLVSPGVQVSVIDESFYTPAEPGTTPMIFVVSAQDKTNGAGTATAAGTTKAKAGTPYLITSQRDLTETFGDPVFKTDTSNNPINRLHKLYRLVVYLVIKNQMESHFHMVFLYPILGPVVLLVLQI